MAWFNSPISHGYITQYQGPGTDTPHYAIDLAAPFHTAFSFPKSGTISQADYAVWSGQPGGGEVFLKPDDGSTQQYVYHLDEIDVSQGQHVSGGQQVGLSGGQNSGGAHPTSSMWSSGPHIHYGFFQQYVNTAAGSRPFGPDITSYYQGLASNSSQQPDLLSSYSVGGLPQQAASGAVGSLFSMPTPDQIARGSLVIGGAILIILGLRSLLGAGKLNIQLPQAGDTSNLEQGTQGDVKASQQQQAAAAKQQAAAAKVAAKQQKAAAKRQAVSSAEKTAVETAAAA